ISAADGVDTTLPSGSGLNPFFGTSAAAPHAGGVAALMKSAVPTASATKIRNAILAAAVDIEAQDVDPQAGHGVIMAPRSLGQLGARPAVFLSIAGETHSGSSGGFIVPGGTGSITVTLLNEGGATAKSVVGTLSSSNPNVTITQGTASFGTIN